MADAPLVRLDEKAFEHIRFKRITPSQYSFREDVMTINVDKSASFLMQAFDEVKPISSVSIEWQTEGRLLLDDSDQEKTRHGDDAVFKIGLLLKGEEHFENPIAPKWIKQVRSLLSEPSDEMIYLVVDSKHPEATSWVNPYNSKVTMISMHDDTNGEGWNRSYYQFEEPVEVVAIWLMADGDNTKSVFRSRVRNITLQ